MAEYIEKTQLIEKLKHRVSTDDDSKFATGFIKGTNEALGIIEEWIASIPAADVAPVVHGQWVYRNFDTICSECRKSAIFDEWEQQAETEFCPHCGAKMDGEVNGICADDKQSLKTCRTCKNYTPNHGYRDGEMGTCCFWKSITGNCMAVHQSRIGCEHYDKKI